MAAQGYPRPGAAERNVTQLLWLCAGMIAAPAVSDLLDVGEKYLTTFLGERSCSI
jgi:hypothetical protein